MKNFPVSILDRLKTLSRESGRNHNLVLEDFATSRLIARLAASEHRDQFILKGAQLFKLWADTPHRPTRDADFLRFGSSSLEELKSIFEEICRIETDPPDALVWVVDGVAAIREDNLYGGVRIRLKATLGNVRIPAQVDIGFGDSIVPDAKAAKWPMPLDFPEVPIQVYQPETSIAEKIHAAVVLDMANSRMKDFFDIDWLSRHCEFERGGLREAVEATFQRRDTTIPDQLPIAYTEAFATSPDKEIQWNAFLRKSRLEPEELVNVVKRLALFLDPVFCEESQPQTWHPESGWTTKKS